jgi:rsbT antagonist protein RsbS
MGVAVLRQGRLLIASVPANATDHDLGGLLDGLATNVGQRGINGVIIDVSALDVLDSYATRLLETIGHVARLRGAETVIVGIQPEVAIAMVQLGVTLEAVQTGLDLEHGIRLLEEAPRDDREDG